MPGPAANSNMGGTFEPPGTNLVAYVKDCFSKTLTGSYEELRAPIPDYITDMRQEALDPRFRVLTPGMWLCLSSWPDVHRWPSNVLTDFIHMITDAGSEPVTTFSGFPLNDLYTLIHYISIAVMDTSRQDENMYKAIGQFLFSYPSVNLECWTCALWKCIPDEWKDDYRFALSSTRVGPQGRTLVGLQHAIGSLLLPFSEWCTEDKDILLTWDGSSGIMLPERLLMQWNIDAQALDHFYAGLVRGSCVGIKIGLVRAQKKPSEFGPFATPPPLLFRPMTSRLAKVWGPDVDTENSAVDKAEYTNLLWSVLGHLFNEAIPKPASPLEFELWKDQQASLVPVVVEPGERPMVLAPDNVNGLNPAPNRAARAPPQRAFDLSVDTAVKLRVSPCDRNEAAACPSAPTPTLKPLLCNDRERWTG